MKGTVFQNNKRDLKSISLARVRASKGMDIISVVHIPAEAKIVNLHPAITGDLRESKGLGK